MQADESVTNMPWGRFGQVFDLMQKGNRAFREIRFEEVFNFVLNQITIFSIF